MEYIAPSLAVLISVGLILFHRMMTQRRKLSYKKLSVTYKSDYQNKMNRIKQIYELMNEILLTSDAQRVLICKSRNGDGLPRVGGKVHVDALYELHDHPIQFNLVDRYTDVTPDKHLIECLIHTMDYGKKTMVLKDLPPSLLKGFYIAEGLTYVEFHYLHTSKTGMYYLSIGTTKETYQFIGGDHSQRSNVELCVSKLKTIFKNHSI